MLQFDRAGGRAGAGRGTGGRGGGQTGTEGEAYGMNLARIHPRNAPTAPILINK